MDAFITSAFLNAPKNEESYLQVFERQERVLRDAVQPVVCQIEHPDVRGLREDLLGQLADAVTGQSQTPESGQSGERVGVHLEDLVLAEVERPQAIRQGAQRGVRNVAEAVRVEREVAEVRAAVPEDVPGRIWIFMFQFTRSGGKSVALRRPEIMRKSGSKAAQA